MSSSDADENARPHEHNGMPAPLKAFPSRPIRTAGRPPTWRAFAAIVPGTLVSEADERPHNPLAAAVESIPPAATHYIRGLKKQHIDYSRFLCGSSSMSSSSSDNGAAEHVARPQLLHRSDSVGSSIDEARALLAKYSPAAAPEPRRSKKSSTKSSKSQQIPVARPAAAAAASSSRSGSSSARGGSSTRGGTPAKERAVRKTQVTAAAVGGEDGGESTAPLAATAAKAEGCAAADATSAATANAAAADVGSTTWPHFQKSASSIAAKRKSTRAWKNTIVEGRKGSPRRHAKGSGPGRGKEAAAHGRPPSARSLQEQLQAELSKNHARVLDLFRRWDDNFDGVIAKKEFQRAVVELGYSALPETIDALFDAFDADGGGTIEYSELYKLLRARAELAPELRAGAKGEIEIKPKLKSSRGRSGGGGGGGGGGKGGGTKQQRPPVRPPRAPQPPEERDLAEEDEGEGEEVEEHATGHEGRLVV